MFEYCLTFKAKLKHPIHSQTAPQFPFLYKFPLLMATSLVTTPSCGFTLMRLFSFARPAEVSCEEGTE